MDRYQKQIASHSYLYERIGNGIAEETQSDSADPRVHEADDASFARQQLLADGRGWGLHRIFKAFSNLNITYSSNIHTQ